MTALSGSALSYEYSLAGDYIDNICTVLEVGGVNVEAIFADASVDRRQVSSVGYRYPLHELNRLYEAASNILQQPLLSLLIGAEVRVRSFPVLGYAAMCAPTLASAISQLKRFERLVWDFGETHESIEGEWVVLSWRPADENIPDYLIEIALSGWLSFGRDVLGSDINKIRHVCFQHTPSADEEAYREKLGVPVLFEQSFNGIVFPLKVLLNTMADADTGMQNVVKKIGIKQLAQYELEVNVVNNVCQKILQTISVDYSEPMIEPVAASLGVSAKNLSRRLSEHGTSFSLLVDKVRGELAKEWLALPDVSLTEVAFALGFSEQSAFSRAFKRWFQTTPADYRRSAKHSG